MAVCRYFSDSWEKQAHGSSLNVVCFLLIPMFHTFPSIVYEPDSEWR